MGNKLFDKIMKNLETLIKFIRLFCKLRKCITYTTADVVIGRARVSYDHGSLNSGVCTHIFHSGQPGSRGRLCQNFQRDRMHCDLE